MSLYTLLAKVYLLNVHFQYSVFKENGREGNMYKL